MTIAVQEMSDVLQYEDSVARLRDIVMRRLEVEKLSRERVLGQLEDLRSALDDEDRIVEEEAVMTVMDQLVGWCYPRWSLSHFGSSEYE